MLYIITNNKGEQIEGSTQYATFEEALAFVEGMRFAGIEDCYVGSCPEFCVHEVRYCG